MKKQITPFRAACLDAANTALLAFVGSLVLGLIGKSVSGLITVEVEKDDPEDD